jgi:hypothetical protein
MSDYNLQVAWSGKDALGDTDPDKVISGGDFNTEFLAVKTAVNSKANLAGSSSQSFSATTANAGTNTTQVATTAFVQAYTPTAATINALVYPVGSIYFNAAVSTNPATLLGFGTWVAYGGGRVPVGVHSSGTFDGLNETGGAETHTLSVAETPSHSHKVAGGEHATGSFDNGDNFQANNLVSVSTARAYQVDTSSIGGGGAHNNLQPYITVYMWKRTA